jgi:hypothetical protein
LALYHSLVGRGYLFLVYDGILKAPRSAASKFRKPLQKAQRCTNEQRFRRVQEADRGLGVRPRRRETDGESFDSLQAAVALGCRIDGIDFEIDRLCVAAIKKAKILS